MGKSYAKIPKKKQGAVGRAISKQFHAHPEKPAAQKIAIGISIATGKKKKKTKR
jgi:hypothetical protein